MGLQMKAKLRGVLEGQMNKQYAERLARAKRHISYEEWLRLVEETGEEREYPYYPGILSHDQKSGGSQPMPEEGTAQSLAQRCDSGQGQGLALLKEQGIWLILQKDGYMDPNAFSWIADHFREYPETLLLYGDEDALDVTGEHRCSPYFKTVWSPDTWLSSFYLGSVIALRRELAEKLPQGTWPQDSEGVVFFKDFTQVRLLVHQLLKLAGGFDQGCDTIEHFPGMLFHMDYDAAQADVQREYWREKESDGLEREHQLSLQRELQEKSFPSISVIIPSKDNPQVLRQCLESLEKCHLPLEILVVDNGSSPENKAEVEKITQGMKYIYDPMPFNFSKMCNRGAREAGGEVLLFLNDDITVCADGWLEAMADRALRPYVGAVGLKLYYPDSTKIQHVGIANLPGGPVHKLQFTQDGQEEDFGYGSLDRNVIAVTGACLMVQQERFWQTGGFREDLQVAYNDVDLCFRLLELGWHNVVLNSFHAYHHESLSRGSDLDREKMQRLCQEKQTLYHRHHQYLDYDPYYPEPLCMELGDMHIYENYLKLYSCSR